MIIEQYGIRLRRITQNDIELIRINRNRDSIRKNMSYQKKISPKAQEIWFQSVNNPNNYYFVIEYNGEKIGVINSKNIHWEDNYGEGGIFVWNEEYIGTTIPTCASLVLLNLSFDILNFDKSYIRVLRSNENAINYNKMLGYTLVPYQEKNKLLLYLLTREKYYTVRSRFEEMLLKKFKENSRLKITGKADETTIHKKINLLFG
jgi:UDP-4-amino-4,6-dideoxy-N-acetyl-beta-L-altrosamine N-acetyltransferase